MDPIVGNVPLDDRAPYAEVASVDLKDGVVTPLFQLFAAETVEERSVAYATGPSPSGPWTERGTVLSKNPEYGILGTGHHSVVNVPGTDDWYVVYHRFALNGPGRPGGDGTHRETTIDRLRFAADGTILPVVPTLGSVGAVETARRD